MAVETADFCSRCKSIQKGIRVAGGRFVCLTCGSKEEIAQAIREGDQAAPAGKPAAAGRVCPGCGMAYPDAQVSCMKCGINLRSLARTGAEKPAGGLRGRQPVVIAAIAVLCACVIVGLLVRSRGRSQDAASAAPKDAKEAALKDGRAALTLKDWATAKAAFEQILRGNPNDPGAKEGLSEAIYGEAMDAARKQGSTASEASFGQAEAALRRALTAKPEDPGAKRELASLLERRAALAYATAMEEAQNLTVKSLDLAKDGKVPELQVSRRKAEEAFKRALEAKPKDPAAVQGLEDLLTVCMTAQEHHAKDMADAQKALAAQDWAAAEACFKRALETKPDAGEAKEGLVRASYERAMADGRKALAEKKVAEAEAAFARALESKPGDSAAAQGLDQAIPPEERYRRAMEQGRRGAAGGDWSAAETAFKAALQLKPGDAEAARELAKIRVETLKMKAAALVTKIRSAVELAKAASPKSGQEEKLSAAEKAAARNAALAKKKGLEEQIQKVNKNLQRTRSVALREKIGAELAGLQQQLAAIEQAFKQEEDLAQARQTIADARKELDALQAEYKVDAAALKDSREAIAVALREVPCPAADRQYRLVENYIGLKEMDKARETLQKIIADFPDSAAAEKARKTLEGLK
jgi:tetratricopeptide (TPR) repeat protein